MLLTFQGGLEPYVDPLLADLPRCRARAYAHCWDCMRVGYVYWNDLNNLIKSRLYSCHCHLLIFSEQITDAKDFFITGVIVNNSMRLETLVLLYPRF